MSHFTRIKTRIVERQYLTQSLRELGYSYEEGEVEVRGFGGNRTPVEIKIRTGNDGYDIGFTKPDQVYELVADWWGIDSIDQQAFVQQLTQRYIYHAARAKLEEQGFTLINEEIEQDGRLHLVLRRVV